MMMMTFYWQIQQSWLFYMLIYAKKIQLAYSEQLKITTQSKTKPYRTISMCVSMTTSASGCVTILITSVILILYLVLILV